MKQSQQSAPNLLGPGPIDDWIEHRRHQHIEVRQKDVHILGDSVLAKAVGEEGEEGRNVEDQDDSEVGATGTQSLVPGILRRQAEDSMEDKAIGNGNEDAIQTHGQQSHSQPVDNIDRDVGTGQASDAHVLTVCVCHDMVTTVRQSPQQEDEWGDNGHTTEKPSKANFAYDSMVENGCISQWVADSHIAIKGHGKKNRGLQGIDRMDTKHLCQASSKGNLTSMEPQNGQHFGHSDGAESQVSE